MTSSYDSNSYDRNWNYECQKVVNYFDYCYWTGYLNDFDQPLHAQCKQNHYINGIESAHSDLYRDRRFRIHCCYSKNIKLKECQKTELINKYRETIQYTAPEEYILHKLESTHDNVEE